MMRGIIYLVFLLTLFVFLVPSVVNAQDTSFFDIPMDDDSKYGPPDHARPEHNLNAEKNDNPYIYVTDSEPESEIEASEDSAAEKSIKKSTFQSKAREKAPVSKGSSLRRVEKRVATPSAIVPAKKAKREFRQLLGNKNLSKKRLRSILSKSPSSNFRVYRGR